MGDDTQERHARLLFTFFPFKFYSKKQNHQGMGASSQILIGVIHTGDHPLERSKTL